MPAAAKPALQPGARSKARSASVHLVPVRRHHYAGVRAAVAGVDDDALADEGRAGGLEGLGLPQELRAATDNLPAEPTQRPKGRGPHSPSGRQPDLALELGDGPSGAGAVDAVGSSDVIPHLQQPFLKLVDVVSEHRIWRRRGRACVVRAASGPRPGPARSLLPRCRQRSDRDSAGTPVRPVPQPRRSRHHRQRRCCQGCLPADRAFQDAADLDDGGSSRPTTDRTHRASL